MTIKTLKTVIKPYVVIYYEYEYKNNFNIMLLFCYYTTTSYIISLILHEYTSHFFSWVLITSLIESFASVLCHLT